MSGNKFWSLLLPIALASLICLARADIGGRLNIRTEDGTTNTYPYQARFTNGTLTDHNDGTVSISITGGGGGGSNVIETMANGVRVTTNTATLNLTGPLTGTLVAGSTAQIAIQGPWNLYPNQIDSGAGTESSPWTNADGTAGIQTDLTTLGTVRSGRISLSPGRFNISSTVQVSTPAAAISGDAAGFSMTNAVGEGMTSTKLRLVPSTGTIFNIGTQLFSSRPAGVYMENLYFVGNSTFTYGAPYFDNSAITFANVDQTRLRKLNFLNFGVAVNLSTEAVDACQFEEMDIAGCGIGIYGGAAGDSNYTVFSNNVISDNYSYGVYLTTPSVTQQGNEILSGNTIVRNCLDTKGCPIDAANVVWDVDEGFITHNTIGIAGLSNFTGADGLVLGGNRNRVVGNDFFQNNISTSVAIRVYGNNNYIGGNTFYQNHEAIRIFGNNNVVDFNVYSGNDNDIIIMAGAKNNIIVTYGARVSDSGTGTIQLGVPLILKSSSSITSEYNNALLQVENDYVTDNTGHASLLLNSSTPTANTTVLYENNGQPYYSVGLHGGIDYQIKDSKWGNTPVTVESGSLNDALHLHNASGEMRVGVNQASPVAALEVVAPGGESIGGTGTGAAYIHCAASYCGLDIGATTGNSTFVELLDATTKKGVFEWAGGNVDIETAGGFNLGSAGLATEFLQSDSSGHLTFPQHTINKALCLTTGGALGHCTSIVDVSGGCTCTSP